MSFISYCEEWKSGGKMVDVCNAIFFFCFQEIRL